MMMYPVYKHFTAPRFSRKLISEQRALAGYLDRETAKIDQMAAKVEEAIARLQEYRTALTTAAVTGKIDVRKESREVGLAH